MSGGKSHQFFIFRKIIIKCLEETKLHLKLSYYMRTARITVEPAISQFVCRGSFCNNDIVLRLVRCLGVKQRHTKVNVGCPGVAHVLAPFDKAINLPYSSHRVFSGS